MWMSFGIDSSHCFVDRSEKGVSNTFLRIGKTMSCSSEYVPPFPPTIPTPPPISTQPIQETVGQPPIERELCSDTNPSPTSSSESNSGVLNGNNAVDVGIKPELSHIRLNFCTMFLSIQCCIR